MIDFWQTVPGRSVARARLLSEGKVWIDTFRNDTRFREEILEYIRQDQLKQRGIDGAGEVIGYYSWVTSRINPEKRFNTHYTLEDTGQFYSSMFIVVTSEYFEITADSQKMEDQEWWRESILELTDENLEKISEKYLERLREYAVKLLFDNL